VQARLVAAGSLLSLGQLAPARAARDEITGSPVLAYEFLRLRHDYLRGRIAAAENRVDEGQRILEAVHLRARSLGDGELVLHTAREMIDLMSRLRRDISGAKRWVREGLTEAQRLQLVSPGPAADVLTAAAMVAVDAGNPAEALSMIKRASELIRPEEQGRRLALVDVQVVALASAGKVDDALALQNQMLDIVRTTLGAMHPRVAELLSVRAALLLDANRAALAADAAHQALQILEATTASTTSVALAETNIAAALLRIGNPDAEAHFLRARKLRVAQLGEDHPDVAHIDANLALIRIDRGDVATGLTMLRRATAIAERALGSQHEQVAEALFNLAVAERTAGDLPAALTTAMRCASIYAGAQGGSSRHASAVAQVAMLQNLRGRHADALETATTGLGLEGTQSDPSIDAWLRLESGRALLAMRTDTARARKLLEQARTGYSASGLRARVTEIDALLATLP
jgi:tetratricopeptide (TPR) repeat protein